MSEKIILEKQELKAVEPEPNKKTTTKNSNFLETEHTRKCCSTFFNKKKTVTKLERPEFEDIEEGLKWLKESYDLLIEGHASYVRSIAITHNNKYIISGGEDKTIRIWNFQKKRQKDILNGHTGYVISLSLIHI